MDYPGLYKDQFHPEKLHVLSVSFLVDTLEESLGGTAGNIVYNLSLLGEKPTLISCAGSDFKKYQTHLAKSGIDTTSIQLEDDVHTAVAHVITDAADNQIAAFYPGAMAREYTKEIPSTADLAIISPGNLTDMNELPKKYRENGVPFFYDPGQQMTALSSEALRGAIEGSAAIFGNDYEIDMILRKLGWTKEQLLERVPVVVTTLGAKGSLVTTPEKEYSVPSVATDRALDPTGAGDAYRAGFAKGWLAELSPALLREVGKHYRCLHCGSTAPRSTAFTMDAFGRDLRAHMAKVPDCFNRPI
jgi:adenosine kinase